MFWPGLNRRSRSVVWLAVRLPTSAVLRERTTAPAVRAEAAAAIRSAFAVGDRPYRRRLCGHGGSGRAATRLPALPPPRRVRRPRPRARDPPASSSVSEGPAAPRRRARPGSRSSGSAPLAPPSASAWPTASPRRVAALRDDDRIGCCIVSVRAIRRLDRVGCATSSAANTAAAGRPPGRPRRDQRGARQASGLGRVPAIRARVLAARHAEGERLMEGVQLVRGDLAVGLSARGGHGLVYRRAVRQDEVLDSFGQDLDALESDALPRALERVARSAPFTERFGQDLWHRVPESRAE